MTITQLQYIMAVARYGSFTTAAEKCYVTQPTLSMQVQKLEEELGVQIFDRSRKPISLTPIGEKLISQVGRVINESTRIKDIVDEQKQDVVGEYRLGIIPSVMPTLLPLFLRTYTKRYPRLQLHIEELQTASMITALRAGHIDAGIAATPLVEEGIEEHPLYDEPMLAFLDRNSALRAEKTITPTLLSSEPILLLERGHCFRNNVLSLCSEASVKEQKFGLSTGNFQTLVELSKEGFGNTVLPYLNTLTLPEADREMLRDFTPPTPSRQISLIHMQDSLRHKVNESLITTIRGIIRAMIVYENTRITSPLEV
jgi:LysR family hydrogen peroxide-inducible transcriptional activator